MEEYLRDYLGNENVDVFEFIKKAITLAATDYPTEFHNNKDKILETLYSSQLISRSSNVNNSQGDGINQTIPKAKTPTIRIVYRQGVDEIMRIKRILEGSESGVTIICDLLAKLHYMRLNLKTLKVTGIGKTLNRVLKRHLSNKDVRQIAGTLMKEWKHMAQQEWDASHCVVQTTEGKKIQADDDKENKLAKGQQHSKVMHSKEVEIQNKTKLKSLMESKNRPNLQRVNNQTISMDVVNKGLLPVSKQENLVSKIQLGINSQRKFQVNSDKENRTKGERQSKVMHSKEVHIQNIKNLKPLMESKKRPKDVVNKALLPASNKKNLVAKVQLGKVLAVSKPMSLVAKTKCGINTQTSKIPGDQPIDLTMPKRSIEEKFEATKRKLRQGYEDLEKMKKKRRIQVMELHQLPKQGLLPQHMKPPLRRSANTHSRIRQMV